MDEVWERAVEAALDGQKDLSSARSLTLDGAVKCVHGRLPPPSLLEKFEQLKQLSIANVGVSSLADFPRLPHLQKLILSDNRIAGGLEFLVEAGLESLRDLDLSNNKIQFIDDLAPLAQLKLVSLDLYECPVTRVVDYRAKVFGMIKSLKYLDKADAEDNERPESDEEESDDDEEDDVGSGEVDGEERSGKLDAGPPDEEEEEDDDEDGDDSDEDEEEGIRFPGNNLLYPNSNHVRSNGFGHGSVFDSHGLKVEDDDDDSSSEDEEDVEDEDDGEAERFLRRSVEASRGFQGAALNGQVNVESSSDDEEIDDEEDEEEEDVENVEVHEVDESEDDDGEDDEDDDEDDDGDEGEEEEDVEEDEEENKQPSSGPLPNAVIVSEGEIDGHDSDDDENGELGEEDEDAGEEEVEYEEEDVEEEEDEEDNGTEYLVQPVSVPAYLPLHRPAPAPVGPAEDEDEASDIDAGLDDDDDEDDDDDDVEEEEDDEHEQKQIPSSKRKRDQDDETDDSGDEDDDDDERPNKKR